MTRDQLTALPRRRLPTEAARGYDHIVRAVARFADELRREAGLGAEVPVSVGMPGSFTRAGRVKNSNTTCLNGRDLRADLAALLPGPLSFHNDADLFALAEARLGAGRGGRLVFGVILGTGVGGGLAIDGQVDSGPQGIRGEWGHTVLDPGSERRCYCGQRGCVETFLSGPAVEGRHRELGGEALGLAEILAARRRGDPVAERCVEEWLEAFGRATANLINILDPDVVVLGGGVSRADELYDEGRERVARHVFNEELATPIRRHELGDSAGTLGALLAG